MLGNNMVYNSDVYFNVIDAMSEEDGPTYAMRGRMHHGDIYVSLNAIYLRDNEQCYKANIQDIKKIETITKKKQILIQLWNRDMIISCSEYSQLLVLHDLISMSFNNLISKDYMFLGAGVIGSDKA